MTKKETMKILSLLKIAYPTSFRELSKSDTDDIVALWAEFFRDDSFQLVTAAVKACIASDHRGFVPAIGQVREQMRKMTTTDPAPAPIAWETLWQTLKEYNYNYRATWGNLTPATQRAIGSVSTLKIWGDIETNILETTIYARFTTAYKDAVTQQAEYDVLSTDLKQLWIKRGYRPLDQPIPLPELPEWKYEEITCADGEVRCRRVPLNEAAKEEERKETYIQCFS